jgi:putative phosphoribosyl transferase
MSEVNSNHRSAEISGPFHDEVRIVSHDLVMLGNLHVPANAQGLIIFAHGSGSSRHSVRNRRVAHCLNQAGFATLLFDLLTLEEEEHDARGGTVRFDVELLAERLLIATEWARLDARCSGFPTGYFGASTGAAAALIASVRSSIPIGAVVSRGGRPDLAGDALNRVESATLLIVGGADHGVLSLNEGAFDRMICTKRLEIIRGATHLFEEPGALEAVARLAAEWFGLHLIDRREV